jgi:type IV fimbrial biogenesis protein FimT
MMSRPAMVSTGRETHLGFTLIELMVTLTLFALLLMLAVPSFTEWVRNNQIRSTAESLQNGLRAAKGRATNLNRQVVFVTTNAAPGLNALGAANGLNWYVQFVPRTAGAVVNEDTSDFYIEGGNFASGVSGITITGGPASICFNSVGRLVNNATPSTSPNIPACVVPAGGANIVFAVSRTGAVAGKDRPLSIVVSPAGQIRMCDPARPAGSPDAC